MKRLNYSSMEDAYQLMRKHPFKQFFLNAFFDTDIPVLEMTFRYKDVSHYEIERKAVLEIKKDDTSFVCSDDDFAIYVCYEEESSGHSIEFVKENDPRYWIAILIMD